MGNQRFRLSHMIPNAWFYRLRDMKIATTPHHKMITSKQQQQQENHQRNSFCYTPKIHQVYTNTNNKLPTESTQDFLFSPALSESPKLLSTTSSSGDNIHSFDIQDSSGYHELIQETEFQELITKSIIHEKYEDTSSQSSSSTDYIYEIENQKLDLGVKMRSKEQRKYVCKRIVYDIDDNQNMVSNRCCIVKPTFDPHKDLKESMMEMIVECNMRAPKDLKKLLTCYISMNSNEYHDIIVKVFKEICLTFDYVV